MGEVENESTILFRPFRGRQEQNDLWGDHQTGRGKPKAEFPDYRAGPVYHGDTEGTGAFEWKRGHFKHWRTELRAFGPPDTGGSGRTRDSCAWRYGEEPGASEGGGQPEAGAARSGKLSP